MNNEPSQQEEDYFYNYTKQILIEQKRLYSHHLVFLLKEKYFFLLEAVASPLHCRSSRAQKPHFPLIKTTHKSYFIPPEFFQFSLTIIFTFA